jgi:hypothetical protein
MERFSRSTDLFDWLVIKRTFRDAGVQFGTPSQMFAPDDPEDEFVSDLLLQEAYVGVSGSPGKGNMSAAISVINAKGMFPSLTRCQFCSTSALLITSVVNPEV